MSFYCNRGKLGPGLIEGSPLEGLCNRVVISCKRVLDSCKKQVSMEDITVTMRDIPPEAQTPFTFISATNTHTDAIISDLRVDRLEERPCFARIRCNCTVPLQVQFLCSAGHRHFAKSSITVYEDIIMYVPEASIFPFEIVASTSCNFASGTITNDQVYGTSCLTLITKVVAETDLLIPAYGYCAPSDCVDYEEQLCNRFFDLPLYPSGK